MSEASGFVLAPPPRQNANRGGCPRSSTAFRHHYGNTLPAGKLLESHWNDAATGIPTSSGRAQGAWQFMPQTAKEYGLADPTDFNAATPAAMHKLADLAQKNGGDWEKAVEQYGTFSTGQGAAADAAVRQVPRLHGQPDACRAGYCAGHWARTDPGPGYVLGMPADI